MSRFDLLSFVSNYLQRLLRVWLGHSRLDGPHSNFPDNNTLLVHQCLVAEGATADWNVVGDPQGTKAILRKDRESKFDVALSKLVKGNMITLEGREVFHFLYIIPSMLMNRFVF
jgi:hypothetical protein